MSHILVIAPHPDDETLGCGGTLLKHRNRGDSLHWLIVTGTKEEYGYPLERVEARRSELELVHKHYGFKSREELELPPARLETLPLNSLIQNLSQAIARVSPDVVYLPWPGDVHSDHQIVFQAANAALKWFRMPRVDRILTYETVSETGFNLDPSAIEFRPNWFVDITDYLKGKQQAMSLYHGESAPFPFPRSPESIDAQARIRGALCGCTAAEGFVLLRSIW